MSLGDAINMYDAYQTNGHQSIVGLALPIKLATQHQWYGGLVEDLLHFHLDE